MPRILLLVFGFIFAVVSPVMAQGNPIGQRIQQRIQESKTFFSNGDYLMGANRVAEAAQTLKSSPDAMPGMTAIGLASSCVESLNSELQKATKGTPQYIKIAAAEQTLLRHLCTWEPQNPRWHYLHGITYMAQAGGPTLNAAGDRASLQMAIRKFDQALACPGADSISADCNQQKSAAKRLLNQRIAKGEEIKQRGVREMMKYHGAPVDSGTKTQGWCSTCNTYHALGDHIHY